MDGATEKSLQRQFSKVKVRAPVRKVRLWTRLSPKHLMRVFVDNYVKGCITVGDDPDLDASSTFQVTLSYEDNNSRPRGRVASARELDLELSGSVHGSEAAPAEHRLVVAESVHLAHNHGAIITSGIRSSMADLHGQTGASEMTTRGADSGAPRITGENNVIRLDTLLQTSALHQTDFLQAASRRGAALGGAHRLGHLTPRGGSGRMLMRRRSLSSTSVSPVDAMSTSRPLTPVTDMSTFREQCRRGKPSRRSLAVRRPSRDVQTPPTAAASPQLCALPHEPQS